MSWTTVTEAQSGDEGHFVYFIYYKGIRMQLCEDSAIVMEDCQCRPDQPTDWDLMDDLSLFRLCCLDSVCICCL